MTNSSVCSSQFSLKTSFNATESMRGTALCVALAGRTLAATIYATSYSGTVDTIGIARNSSGAYTLAHTASIAACGGMPSWLTLDKAAGVLYCANEAVPGSLSAFSVGSSPNLTLTAVAGTIGGDVNSHVYGGRWGDSFIVLAE